MSGFTDKWAALVIKWRLQIILGWAVLLLVSGYLGRDIQFDHTIERNFASDDAKVQDYQQLQDLFGDNEYLVVGVTAPEAQTVFTAQTMRIINQLTLFLEQEEAVTQVRSLSKYQYIQGDEENLRVADLFPNQLADNLTDNMLREAEQAIQHEALALDILVNAELTEARIAARILYAKGSPAHKVELVKSLYDFVEQQGYAEQGYRIRYGGQPVFDEQFETRNQSDSALLYPLMAVIMLVLLWLSFRSWYVTVMPWTAIIAAIVILGGIQGLLGYPHTAVDQALVPTIIIIGVGLCMHILLAFVRASAASGSTDSAIRQTIQTLWRPCFYTALTTAIGFFALSVTDIVPVREMAVLGTFGPVILFLLSFSLLPALMSYRKAAKAQRSPSVIATGISRITLALPGVALRYRKSILLAAILLFIGTALAITTVKVDTNFVEYFKQDNPARQDMLYFDQQFDGAMTMEVIIDSGQEDGIKQPEFLQRAADLEQYLQQLDATAKILSVMDYLKEINRSIHAEQPEYFRLPDSHNKTSQLLFLYENAGPDEDLSDMRDFDNRYLRLTVPMRNMPASEMAEQLQQIEHHLATEFADLTITLTGVKLLFQAQDVYTSQGMVKSFGLSLLVISLFFFVIFRSFKLGLYCIIPSVLPIIVVAAATGLLGISLDLGTMIVGAMTMGLAVDDSIHMVSRYARAKAEGQATAAAVAVAIQDAGTAVVFSSLVLVFGFSALTLGTFVPIIHVGLFSAAIMALALLADLLLLPAIIYTLDKDDVDVASGQQPFAIADSTTNISDAS